MRFRRRLILAIGVLALAAGTGLANGPGPASAAPLLGIAAVSAGGIGTAGEGHTCALTTGGGVKCWGYNGNGQLGNGTTTNRPTPVDVVATAPYPIGDVNCDGTVNAIDAALDLQVNAGRSVFPNCYQNADVNGDGQINSLDALLVLQYDAGLLGTFPAG